MRGFSARSISHLVLGASTLAIWLAIWFMPLAALLLVFGGGHVFSAEAVFFSKMAMVTFGGAYAVLAYVAQQAVESYGWLAPGEMLDGLGLAETTPGPLIMVTQFVGFLAAYRAHRLEREAQVLARLAAHGWPGNLRELRNLVQRLHPVSRHRDIALRDLPPEITVDRRDDGPYASPAVRPAIKKSRRGAPRRPDVDQCANGSAIDALATGFDDAVAARLLTVALHGATDRAACDGAADGRELAAAAAADLVADEAADDGASRRATDTVGIRCAAAHLDVLADDTAAVVETTAFVLRAVALRICSGAAEDGQRADTGQGADRIHGAYSSRKS